MPRRSASATTNKRSSSGWRKRLLSPSSLSPAISLIQSDERPISSERTAFCNAASKRAIDRHDLARRFHLSAEDAVGRLKLIKRPAGKLDHAIVEAGSKHAVLFWVTAFGISSRRSPTAILAATRAMGYPVALDARADERLTLGVDLDNAVFHAVGIQGKLDVAAAFDAQVPDDAQRGASQHLVLFVRQGLAWGHDDGVARMNADGIDVFHAADRDRIVGAVPDHFKLDLFPACDTAVEEDLASPGCSSGPAR